MREWLAGSLGRWFVGSLVRCWLLVGSGVLGFRGKRQGVVGLERGKRSLQLKKPLGPGSGPGRRFSRPGRRGAADGDAVRFNSVVPGLTRDPVSLCVGERSLVIFGKFAVPGSGPGRRKSRRFSVKKAAGPRIRSGATFLEAGARWGGRRGCGRI